MKLLGSTNSKITKDENSKNVSHYSNLILSIGTINKIQESCIHLFQISHLVNF